MALQSESRSALAVGVEWAAKVTTIAVGFCPFPLPAFIGFGIDRWLGWTPVATLASGSFWVLYRGSFRRSG